MLQSPKTNTCSNAARPPLSERDIQELRLIAISMGSMACLDEEMLPQATKILGSAPKLRIDSGEPPSADEIVGTIKAFQKLLDPEHPEGGFAAFWAIHTGRACALKTMADAGLDIHGPSVAGPTTLVAAAELASIEGVQELLALGAPIPAAPQGIKSLLDAARNGAQEHGRVEAESFIAAAISAKREQMDLERQLPASEESRSKSPRTRRV